MPAQHPAGGWTTHSTNRHRLNLDVTHQVLRSGPASRSCHLTHELMQQSPAEASKQPPLPHFHSFLVSSNTAPASLRQPWRQTKHTQEWASSPRHRCKPVWFALFVHRFTNQSSSSFLPSSLKDLPPRSFGREAERLPFRAACLISHNAIALASLHVGPQQTPPPSPHPLGLGLSQVPTESPFILVLNTSLWNH